MESALSDELVDVVVVGAGYAGLATASALVKARQSVIVRWSTDISLARPATFHSCISCSTSLPLVVSKT